MSAGYGAYGQSVGGYGAYGQTIGSYGAYGGARRLSSVGERGAAGDCQHPCRRHRRSTENPQLSLTPPILPLVPRTCRLHPDAGAAVG